MLSHYLLTLYRSLTRHRLYAALNVLGLAVGIAVFLVLLLDVQFETGFERWIPDSDQIYAVRTQSIGAGTPGLPPARGTMGGLLDEMRSDYPQLVGARIWMTGGTVIQGGQITSVPVSRVDATFFKVFDLALLEGDRNTALSEPDGLIISQTQAKHYFGAVDPLGQRLTLVFNGDSHLLRVTGVIADLPAATELQLEFMVPLKPPTPAQDPTWRGWGDIELSTYLRFATPQAAHALDLNFDAFTDRHGAQSMGAKPPPHQAIRLRTFPLTGLHLSNSKDATIISALGVVGVLTLLLALVNYVNLATARAGLRAREVAVRKVLGATQAALIGQFMGEAMATAAIGALIGLAICEFLLPLVNAAGGLTLRIRYFGATGVLPLLLAVTAVIGLGAGIYPALVLARFRPAAVLASARTPGGGRAGARVREGLVVAQFAIAIAFTIGTAVIVSQSHFVRQADLGFARHGLIVVSSFESTELTDAQRLSLLTAWRALPDVTGATMADIGPGDDDSTWNSTTERPGAKTTGPAIYYVRTAPDFFTTFKARLIAGRLPDSAHGADFLPPMTGDLSSHTVGPTQNIVLNTSAVRALGFSSPQAAVGQPVLNDLPSGLHQPMTVIGVVGDIRFRSPRASVPPTCYLTYAGGLPVTNASVRYSGANPKVVMARMEAQWRAIAPTIPFRARTIEDNLAHYYRPDDQHGRLFTLGAVLAVGIGCVGLYGMAAFNTARRTREMGIRKTLGASTGDILRLLIGQFLRPVLVANLIAWPLAYVAMRSWLSGFDQRVGLSPLYFIAATVLALVIATGTVAGQAWRVAQAAPTKALRHE
ncbi:MAG: ABC transporter permease [Caulobacteraceae bacterium]